MRVLVMYLMTLERYACPETRSSERRGWDGHALPARVLLDMRWMPLVLAAALVGCGSENSENSPVCGFAILAAANRVLDQFQIPGKILAEVPQDMGSVVPARVVGYGTAPTTVSQGEAGVELTYRGEGFPPVPGFGLVLVEDSTDTFRGVLIYEIEPPSGLPWLGTISSGNSTIPLYGLRVTWGAVSEPRCPLFRSLEETGGT
jgi:hypothetical protein